MSFVPTKANLDERRLEHEQATLRDQQQGKETADHAEGSVADPDQGQDPLSLTADFSTTAKYSQLQSEPQPTSLSSTFNAPTYIEISLHNAAKNAGGLRRTIKRWTKRGPTPTVA